MSAEPVWIHHGTPLPPLLSEAEAAAMDAAMHQDKQARPGRPLVDGYEARRQQAAERHQRRELY